MAMKRSKKTATKNSRSKAACMKTVTMEIGKASTTTTTKRKPITTKKKLNQKENIQEEESRVEGGGESGN